MSDWVYAMSVTMTIFTGKTSQTLKSFSLRLLTNRRECWGPILPQVPTWLRGSYVYKVVLASVGQYVVSMGMFTLYTLNKTHVLVKTNNCRHSLHRPMMTCTTSWLTTFNLKPISCPTGKRIILSSGLYSSILLFKTWQTETVQQTPISAQLLTKDFCPCEKTICP